MEYNNDPKLVEELTQLRNAVARLLVENKSLKESKAMLRAIITTFIDSNNA